MAEPGNHVRVGEPRAAARRGLIAACVHCLLGVLLFALADRSVFGSGWYWRWAAPESSAGTMAAAAGTLRHIPAGRSAILLLGDSRVGEGFSAPAARRVAQSQGLRYDFHNAAVAGTTPRVWFYLLRQLRDPSQRLAAVAVMLTSYRDDDPEPLAERSGDIAFVHPLLGLGDIGDFPRSFPDLPMQIEAAEAILLKGLFFGADLRDFLANPVGRVRQASAWRREGFDWIRNYPGRATSLAGLALDPAGGRLILPRRDAEQTALLPAYADELRRFGGYPPVNPAAAAYRREWLGRIAALCRQAHVPLFVFRIPRGPLHYLAAPDETPSGALAELAASGAVTPLPAGLSTGLERPEYFFDALHMNRAGRALFSAELADAILRRLQPSPQA